MGIATVEYRSVDSFIIWIIYWEEVCVGGCSLAGTCSRPGGQCWCSDFEKRETQLFSGIFLGTCCILMGCVPFTNPRIPRYDISHEAEPFTPWATWSGTIFSRSENRRYARGNGDSLHKLEPLKVPLELEPRGSQVGVFFFDSRLELHG